MLRSYGETIPKDFTTAPQEGCSMPTMSKQPVASIVPLPQPDGEYRVLV